MSPDRIVKKVLLRASRRRVWRAVSNSEDFGSWFGIEFDEPFTPGTPIHGVIIGTTVDAEAAKAMQPYHDMPYSITVEQMETERLFSFRWHPNALERGVDYTREPSTLVVFELAQVPDGTQVTLTESGFDAIPSPRRESAFKANDTGWNTQLRLLEKYVTSSG